MDMVKTFFLLLMSPCFIQMTALLLHLVLEGLNTGKMVQFFDHLDIVLSCLIGQYNIRSCSDHMKLELELII